MDKQKTQRIIGIFVIIAFVIILIPLFFSKTDVSTQVTSVKVSPLPVQPEATTTLAKADTTEGQTPEDSAILGSSETESNNTATPQPVADQVSDEQNNDQNNTQNTNQPMLLNTATNTDKSTANDPVKNNDANPAPVDIKNSQPNTAEVQPTTDKQDNNANNGVNIKPEVAEMNANGVEPASTEVKAANEQPLASPASSEEIKPAASPVRDVFYDNAPVQNKVKKHRIITTEKKTNSTKIKPVNLSNAQIAKLTSTAWVVQMGNFKDKDNARRLADKLRVAGYKAFTKEIKSAKGNISTRVYIGPEFKQASAVKLSNKVLQDMKMQGVVVTIKPLEL